MEYIDAVNCTAENFKALYNDNPEIYEAWDGYSILCPDLESIGKMSLQGTTQTVMSKAFIFQISKCSNDTLNPG
jgi:hypothetical protein